MANYNVNKYTFDNNNYLLEDNRLSDDDITRLSNVAANAASIAIDNWDGNGAQNISSLVINKLTQAQYNTISSPSNSQLYFITDDTIYAEKSYVDNLFANVDALPSQSGNSGKYLTTNGTTASWTDNPSEVFKITLTYAGGGISADKSYAQIIAAITAGKYVYAEKGGYFYSLATYDNNAAQKWIAFLSSTVDPTEFYVLYCYEDGNVWEEEEACDPGYSSHTHRAGDITSGTLGVARGGTGKASWIQGGILYASASTTLANTAAGTSGYLLQSGGTGAPSWINATNANTASTIVKRDASGNFSAGTITATLNGNASTATTATSATSATTATYLISANANPTYGVNRLEYFNASLAAGAAANTTGSPTQDWYYHLRMNHANSGGYYVDIAPCFHNDNIYWKRVSNGGVSNNKWMHIWVEGNAVTSAVWNDYAEYRETDTQEFGRCVIENGDDTMSLSTKRLQKGCSITSDTWGFAQGQTEKAKTPIAVSGRVLAYPFENKEEFRKHIGDAVCSGPEGTVSIMTDEEVQKYPLSIIGTISAVPDYEEWGGGSDRDPVKVNGRVWIRIK